MTINWNCSGRERGIDYPCIFTLMGPDWLYRWQSASWVASAAERYECSRLNSVQERTMPEFRCKMLNERGGTLFSADITADTLDGAIRQAAEVYHTSNLSSPSRRVHAFEVWSGTSRLFPPPLT